jgi:hypothetical protein
MSQIIIIPVALDFISIYKDYLENLNNHTWVKFNWRTGPDSNVIDYKCIKCRLLAFQETFGDSKDKYFIGGKDNGIYYAGLTCNEVILKRIIE